MKRGLELVSYMIYEKIYFSRYISLDWPNFIAWLPLLIEVLRQYVFCNYLLSSRWSHKFWIKLSLLLKPVFYKTKKSRQKFKRAFIMKWKAFFIIFKGLSITRNCLRPDSGSLNQRRSTQNQQFSGFWLVQDWFCVLVHITNVI